MNESTYVFKNSAKSLAPKIALKKILPKKTKEFEIQFYNLQFLLIKQ